MLFEAPQGTKLRHEWKHHISPADKQEIIRRMRVIASPDPHYGEEPYHIRSLYFDNAYDKALSERMNGAPVREKFRIRYYNGDTSYIVLEKKSKFRSLCGKISTRVSREQCEALLDGNLDWLKNSTDPLCRELYAKMQSQLLRPKVIVDYTRRAFVYPTGNVRVTIDDDVRTGLSQVRLFDPVTTIPADFTRPIILEVKYDEFCPGIILDAVQLSDRRTTCFSKYAACRLTNL